LKKFTKLNKIKKKKIILSVTNDLTTDQRMHKIATTLLQMGLDVTLIGRKLSTSQDLNRAYKTVRLPMFFTKKIWFYAEYNIRLFFYLLFHSFDAFVANDLDTLLANYWLSKLKRKTLFYDSHEYFTEVPELEGRFAKKVWLAIEKWIFPKLKDVITVNDSIAAIYKEKYGVEVGVVRNLPMRFENNFLVLSHDELGIPMETKVIVLQGSGINLDRGGEEAVLAMKQVENAILLVIGGGDALPKLKQMVSDEGLEGCVKFVPRQTPEQLYRYTAMAEVGLSLDKDTNLNYRYSLPNKLFDYINCGVPILASNLPEVAKIVNEYHVGLVLKQYAVKDISFAINKMLNEDFKNLLAPNLKKASEELIWDRNLEVLNDIYQKYL